MSLGGVGVEMQQLIRLTHFFHSHSNSINLSGVINVKGALTFCNEKVFSVMHTAVACFMRSSQC